MEELNEIEKKFLVKAKPSSSKCIEVIYIEQGYLSRENDIRIRKETKSYKSKNKISYSICIKSEGDMIRKEKTTPIQHNTFMDLMNGIEGKMIEKIRKTYDIGNGLIAELDTYISIPDLMVVEVEFKTKEDADNFIIPDWFGLEVTFDKRYKNKNLAMR